MNANRGDRGGDATAQSADAWLRNFGRLNVYRAKGGQAPHRPLLLLVILEAAEWGELPAGELELTPELAFQFFEFWRTPVSRPLPY